MIVTHLVLLEILFQNSKLKDLFDDVKFYGYVWVFDSISLNSEWIASEWKHTTLKSIPIKKHLHLGLIFAAIDMYGVKNCSQIELYLYWYDEIWDLNVTLHFLQKKTLKIKLGNIYALLLVSFCFSSEQILLYIVST